MKVFLLCCFTLSILPVVTSFAESVESLPATQGLADQSIIVLNNETQRLSGLKTMTLMAVNRQTEFTAYGKVISLQPLLTLHNKYLVMLTERRSTTAMLTQARQSIIRQQNLYQSGVTSKRSLQDQQAQWQTNKAQADAVQVHIAALADEVRLNWGPELSTWILSDTSDKWSRFLSRRQNLLHIILPTGKQLEQGIGTIYIDSSGDRSKAGKAHLISVAPQTGSVVQGESYFFETGDAHLRIGMNVTAWIPEHPSNQPGVVIPESALLWSMNQAFVYIKIGKENFIRRPIPHYSVTPGGYFIAAATLRPGEQIVVTGAQMLLSEEHRGQIPADYDND
jgi:hypothetical protein